MTDQDEFVRIEIAQLTGELLLEVRVEVATARIVGHVRGTNVTWQAEGVRITVPASAAELIRETLTRMSAPSPPPRAEGETP